MKPGSQVPAGRRAFARGLLGAAVLSCLMLDISVPLLEEQGRQHHEDGEDHECGDERPRGKARAAASASLRLAVSLRTTVAVDAPSSASSLCPEPDGT